MKIALVTGGFDPLHSGHLAYLREASKLADELWVGVNSDEWLARKKGKPFMPLHERLEILDNLVMTSKVFAFKDEDDTAIEAITRVLDETNVSEVIFCNGGDRTKDNIPEQDAFHNNDKVNFVFGVGGNDKKNSSSWILEEYKHPKTDRPWGYYRVLFGVGNNVKLKELTVDPGQRLSMQRHQHRTEHWFVSEGTATVYTINVSSDAELLATLNTHQTLRIDEGQWHQLVNETDKPVKIIEIQYGENCIEDDIERVGVSDDYGKATK